MSDDQANALLDMTVGIVANYVSNNQVRPDELAALISATHAALSGAGSPTEEPVIELTRPTTAQVKRSVSDAGIVSFIDGKTYQSLKRHLGTNGYTPQSYREAFGLRSDYQMVSPRLRRAPLRFCEGKRAGTGRAQAEGQGGCEDGKAQALASNHLRPRQLNAHARVSEPKGSPRWRSDRSERHRYKSLLRTSEGQPSRDDRVR